MALLWLIIERRASAVPPRPPTSRPAHTCASRARTSAADDRGRLPARVRCRAARPRPASRAAARSCAPAAIPRARAAPALREASRLISSGLPFRAQREYRLIDIPARVVAVEGEANASLAVPCQHAAPRDSLRDRL